MTDDRIYVRIDGRRINIWPVGRIRKLPQVGAGRLNKKPTHCADHFPEFISQGFAESLRSSNTTPGDSREPYLVGTGAATPSCEETRRTVLRGEPSQVAGRADYIGTIQAGDAC